ncbi:MAG: alpha/beta hydrolase [Planctomycetota bacterium]
MKSTIFGISLFVILVNAAAAPQKPSDFVVKTDDGYQINGDVMIQKKKDAKFPVVVFIHDAKGRRTQFSDAAAKFYKAGYAAVTFDLRGHNQSTKKEGRDINLEKDDEWKLMRRDVAAVLNWCKEQKELDTDRIVMIGAGFGAALALKSGTIDEGVKAVITLSCPLAAPYTKDDCSKFVEKLAPKTAMLMYAGKGEDDKKNLKDIKYYAEKANPKAFLDKPQSIDAKGADLLAQKPGIADEMIAWLKKNAFDPAKK